MRQFVNCTLSAFYVFVTIFLFVSEPPSLDALSFALFSIIFLRYWNQYDWMISESIILRVLLVYASTGLQL